MQNTQQALRDGLADAVGFVGGALAGWWVGKLLGFDVLAAGPMDVRGLIAWLLLMAGCGAGKLASQRWKQRWRAKPD